MHPSLPPTLVVAGTRSGCGKTSVALGLMRALTRRGLLVQGFKVGPDFIDPGHHALATGRPSHNLDSWLCGPDGLRDIFARQAAGADVAVIEGVMGLFDGFSATDTAGSTAQAAHILHAPVLLVADAASMARSVAALVGGYLAFDPDLPFAGVLLNNAASPSHAALLAEAMADALPAVRLWGVLPRRDAIATPSRHLGLVTAGDSPDAARRLDALANWIEAGCDVERMIDSLPAAQGRRPWTPSGGIIPPEPPGRENVRLGVARDWDARTDAQGRCPWTPSGGIIPPDPPGRKNVRLGIARDRAFCFYYEENLRLLQEAGAQLVTFSPLAETALPEGLDGLYLGGGYPELWARELAQNVAMRRAVQAFCAAGRPVLAECGGFMYLMEAVADRDGTRFPMADVFPMQAVMGDRLAALGYRAVTTRAASPLGPAGTVLRGHEFHYSRLAAPAPETLPAVYALTGRQGPIETREGFLIGQTLGSYVHLHLGSQPQVARHFVAACAGSRGEKNGGNLVFRKVLPPGPPSKDFS